MKNLLNKAIASAIVLTTCFNCSTESIESNQLETSFVTEEPTLFQDTQDPCVDQDPRARISNNGSTSVTLEIANLEGTILHTVADLSPGNVSGFLTFAPDNMVFIVTKGTTGVADEKVTYDMTSCMSYDMEIGPDNNLTSSTPVNL